MKIRSLGVFCFCGLALALPIQCAAQGSVEGIVTDPTGAHVPGVAVHIWNAGTSARFFTSTNQAGLFHFLLLPAGTYELEATHPGFAKWMQRNLEVSVGARVNLLVSLQIASKGELLVVVGEPPLVEITRSHVSATVDRRAISQLPLNGRDYLSLVLLTPGVTRDVRGGLSFGGQRALNTIVVDGVDSNDTFFDQPLGSEGLSPSGSFYQFSQDAVQEFQVNTNSYSAELGHAAGGVTRAVTRSGDNQLHFSGAWFYRDRGMNANDSVNKLNGRPRSPYHFNQFAGSVGGPFIRNRLFYFFNYDGLRNSTPNPGLLNLSSNFTLSPVPAVAAFQQLALNYLAPRSASSVNGLDQNVTLAKLDWLVTPVHQSSLRWSRQRLGTQASAENSTVRALHVDTLTASLTSTLSSSWVNLVRFARVWFVSSQDTLSNAPQADIFEGGQRVLIVGQNTAGPQRNTLGRFQLSDALSHARGRHLFKAGPDVLWNRQQFFSSQNFLGNYRFNSLEGFGRSLAGAPAPVAGDRYLQVFSGTNSPGVKVQPDTVEFAAYLQDEWRPRPGLTLNLGLRYDVQSIAPPPVRNPSPALFAAGLDTSSLHTAWNHLSPRLGLAWAPRRSSRFVVRGGYGIFYGEIPAILASRAHFQNGITVETREFFGATPSAGLIPSYPNSFCGPPDPQGTPPSCAAPVSGSSNPIVQPFAHDYTQPYSHQGTLGAEFQVRANLSVSAGYLVVLGRRLHWTRDVNLAFPVTPTTIRIAGSTTAVTFERFNSPRPLAGFDRILLYDSNARSAYHGVFLESYKRFSHNFLLRASYTLSKVMDDNPNQYAVNPGGADSNMPSDPLRPRGEYGPGSNDQRHRFVLSGIWELNYANRLRGPARVLLGGWQLSGIFTAQSGQPYSGLVSFDLNNDGNLLSDRTPGLGRNTFYPPATVSFDSRLTRRVRITERAKLEFIWEAFNVFNHGNVTAVRTTQFARSTFPIACGIAAAPCLVPQNTGLSAFGTPTATSGPRIMQLSVRFLF